MIEVDIRDFQSIAHVSIQVDGFTSLVGRSNIGKSAIVRAVKAALTGAPVDALVRHGPQCVRIVKGSKTCKCFCSVHMRTEGFDLLWEKGDAVNRYVYNGQEYSVAGRGTPEFLQSLFSLVKVGDERQLLQISDQFSPIFLLNQSGTVVADVLSDVAHLERINTAVRLAEKDRKEATAARKVRERDVIDLKLRLVSFDGLDELLGRVQLVEDTERRVAASTSSVHRLEAYHRNLVEAARGVRALDKVTLIVVPPLPAFQSLRSDIDTIVRFEARVLGQSEAIETLEGVSLIPSLDVGPLVNLGIELARLDAWIAKLRSSKELFGKWKGIEASSIPDIAPRDAAYAKSVELSSLATRVSGISRTIHGLELALRQVRDEEQQLIADLEDMKMESNRLGLCPTCARPIYDVHTHLAVNA